MESRQKNERDIVQNMVEAASLQVGSLVPIMMLYWRVAAEALTTAAQAATVVVATRAAEGIAEIERAEKGKSTRGQSARKTSRKRRSGRKKG
jgi:hypothetical protein